MGHKNNREVFVGSAQVDGGIKEERERYRIENEMT